MGSGFFKVWTFFRCFDRDLRELKQNNKFDTDQLLYYILNILLTSSKNQIYEFRIPNIYNYFFNNIRLMHTLCFLVASVKLKVYKKVVKFSFKQQEILGIRNS